MSWSWLKRTNRFHLLVAFCWQFALFFGTQLLFPIFSSYVPRWRCLSNDTEIIQNEHLTKEFGRNCTSYGLCSKERLEFEHIYFQSASLEFDLICGPKAYIATLSAQLQF